MEFTFSVAALAKVVKHTYKIRKQFLAIYVILGLSVMTWLLLLFSFICQGNKVIYSMAQSYLAF